MPTIRPEVVALIASVALILVQLLKGVFSGSSKKWIPLILITLLTLGGVGLAAAYHYDLIAGALEGFFGAASSVGLYEGLAAIPVVNRAVNSKGWISTANNGS